jgi:hypothetical protein
MGVDSSDVVIAKRLLDHAKLRGFAFHRTASGEDGPLVGKRGGGAWVDVIHIAGFSRDCLAVRQRTSSLILVGHGLWGSRSRSPRLSSGFTLLVRTR